jgi:DNA-directed RNA polymerase specialized sigma24 family protein
MKREHDFKFCSTLRAVKSTSEPIDALLEDLEYRRKGMLICCALAPNQEIAEELFHRVSQKVWLNVMEHFTPDWEKAYGNFFAWLRTIARNTLFDGEWNFDSHLDADPVEDHFELADSNPNPEERLLMAEEQRSRRKLVERILKHVDSLPRHLHLATKLIYLKGRSSRRSAEILNRLHIPCSHATALSWAKKGLEPFFPDGVSSVKKAS